VDIVWDPSLFPIPVPGSGMSGGWSNICFDSAYDVLVAGQYSSSVFRVARTTGAVSTVSTTVGTGDALVSVAYHGPSNMIYVGQCCSGTIYEVDPTTGSSSTFATTSLSSVNGLVFAPMSFGSYGGHLIGCSNNGSVIAVDLSAPTSPATIATGLGSLSDLEFASDGTLYVAASSTVITVSATGSTTTVATGFSAADGIAVDDGRSLLYVADSSTDQLYSVTMTGGTRTSMGGYDFDSGYYPSGLLYDGVGTIIMSTGESSLTLVGIAP
jgi:sugar lactone lactonase YvrE